MRKRRDTLKILRDSCILMLSEMSAICCTHMARLETISEQDRQGAYQETGGFFEEITCSSSING